MKRLILSLLVLLCASISFTQNETDALRYSYLNYSGTSRFLGTGGSLAAMGADLTAVSLNPGGVGRYSKSDFSFSMNITSTNTGAQYNEQYSSDNRGNLNIPNIGCVFVAPVRDGSQWRNFQFGYIYNRTNDFQSNDLIKGVNNNSQLDVFTEWAQGILPENLYDNASFDAGIAYSTYLLEYDDVNGEYYPWYSTDSISQTLEKSRRGAQSSSDIVFGGNYADILYIGGSIGFPSIRYKEKSTLTEEFGTDTLFSPAIHSYDYAYNLTTRGSGFNMKVGFILQPIKQIRLGLAVHSPSWYGMSDRFNATIDSYFVNGETYQDKSKDGFYEYRLKTPARLISNLGIVLGKRGFLSAQYEYVDYKNAKLNSSFNSVDNYSFNNENQTIRNNYQSTSNISIGGEFRVTNNFFVRGGYAIYGSPIKSDIISYDASRKNYSGGIGYRDATFYLDFAYTLSKRSEDFYLYDPNIVNAAKLNYALNSFAITGGIRF